MRVTNELPRGSIPPGSARNRRAPADRPAVWAVLRIDGAPARRVPGRALAWIGDAVWVEVDVDGFHHEVWLSSGDVERRAEPGIY